jgi:hypothetical protein
VRDRIPAGPGHVLITSRNPGWGELATRVDVDVLPRPESVALLRTYRPGLEDVDADQLADALGDLPLALAQAGGFLAESGMSASRYQSLLTSQAGEVLDQNAPATHPHSVAAAIHLAAQRLAEVDPAALALARVGAFLAPEPVSADLLTAAVAVTATAPAEVWDRRWKRWQWTRRTRWATYWRGGCCDSIRCGRGWTVARPRRWVDCGSHSTVVCPLRSISRRGTADRARLERAPMDHFDQGDLNRLPR